jgi:hypothetical protein
MTASMGGEVQSNRLFGAAPESTLAGTQAVDAEGKDGGDLGEVVGRAAMTRLGGTAAAHRALLNCGLQIRLQTCP